MHVSGSVQNMYAILRIFALLCSSLKHTHMKGGARGGAATGHICAYIYDGTLIFMASPLVIWKPISMGRWQQQEPNLLRFIFHFSATL